MKKGLIRCLTAITLAVSFFALPQEPSATETCSLTINANQNVGSNWSYAGGACEGFMQGIYVPDAKQFNITGIYTSNVQYSGQQFHFRIPIYDDLVTLTVHTIKPGATAPEKQTPHTFIRHGGADRYETNQSLTKDIPAQSLDHVFIASGLDYPDALAGGALSGSLNGTIMIINERPSTQEDVLREIERILKPNGKILILGGTGAVSINTENRLKATDYSVERLSGQTRTHTALAIAEELNNTADSAFLVNGRSYPDSLSIVPVAAKLKQPILLNSSADSLNPEVTEYLKSSGIKKVTLIGGTGVISDKIVQSLKLKGIAVERISGKTRHDTSLAVAKKYFPSTTEIGLAYSRNFPDALSGGPFSFRQDMPILLTDDAKPTDAIRTWVNQQDRMIHFFGGTGALPESLKSHF